MCLLMLLLMIFVMKINCSENQKELNEMNVGYRMIVRARKVMHDHYYEAVQGDEQWKAPIKINLS